MLVLQFLIRLKLLGMNTYLYAPKDDLKHRALWKDPYDVEECENLTQLIKCAKEYGITFYYALSPGLDMVFSESKDFLLLKKKMEQMQKLGCTAFALLFDDIDPALKGPDQKSFSSFGEAQVKVTNEIYHALNKPKFLFCPTEYCATRAIPNVESSSYLQTLGQNLDGEINILWTGPKVISNVISPHSIQTLSSVLKRKPVIWDNIHANDYDQRRMFLGPYYGRPTQLYDSVNGVLTNPNCEFESNFVAVHTLGTWVKCAKGHLPAPVPAEEPMSLDVDAEKQSACSDAMDDDIEASENEKIEKMESKDNGVGGDFPMETDSVTSVASSTTKITNHAPAFYDPEIALNDAIDAWLLEFNKEKSASSKVYAKSGPYSLAPAPTIVRSQAAMSTATTTSSSKTAKQNSRKDRGIIPPPPGPVPPGNLISIKTMEENLMEISESRKGSNSPLKAEDLLLLVDLFYLPYTHGTKAKLILSEFKWLKNNAIKEDSEEFKELTEEEQTAKIIEWKDRAEKFHALCQSVSDMFVRFSETPNRALLYDIYPYIWDVKESVLLLDTFVVWLNSKSRLKRQRPHFYPEDPEPWVFRGGLCGDLQRLLPVDSNHDMFNMSAPDVPTTCVYTIRPFQPEDEKNMYEICLSTCDDGQDGHDLFVNEPSMVGDRYVGPYINICPEHIFVVEDSYGVCAYALSTSDSKRFYDLYKKDWLPKMREKYPNPRGDSENWTYAEHIANSFYTPNIFLTEELYSKHSAHVKVDILPRAQMHFPMKRLITCVLSALKAEGCNGVYSEVSLMNRDLIEAFCRLGFYEIQLKDQPPEDTIYYGRTF
ncbi:protein O-GlcNAcase-like isoform X2 [Actinia tenebrosa]|uniref:protein O-GlcNAcase n=1 Tax=Actinia tenebrosa TaxID=6105 RepID=A0A6P8HM55_ACTTE|nr:protein O-GlcNAcase-like isoform X2 [Actinia tenebrosa]